MAEPAYGCRCATAALPLRYRCATAEALPHTPCWRLLGADFIVEADALAANVGTEVDFVMVLRLIVLGEH